MPFPKCTKKFQIRPEIGYGKPYSKSLEAVGISDRRRPSLEALSSRPTLFHHFIVLKKLDMTV